MLKVYRPAGNSISLQSLPFDNDLIPSKHFRFYQSGTAALSAAISACIQMYPKPTQQPEILLPAYACPDLISAILFADAKPVLVDLEQDSPNLSLQQLSQRVNENSIAIIMVNFLGLQEQLSDIRQICNNHNLQLIHDSAQWFPKQPGEDWPGDFNIISFGRGKPVNLLHGGAVICSQSNNMEQLIHTPAETYHGINSFKHTLKILLYNFLIKPFIYGVVSRLPGLQLGQTVFKPLMEISSMNIFYQGLIKPNIKKYSSHNSTGWQLHQRLKMISSPDMIDLFPVEKESDNVNLLRYPLLIKRKELRDAFYQQTKHYGVSLLYPRPLNEISGLEEILHGTSVYPNASQFADHLVTLPTHEDVDELLMDKIVTELKKILATQSN